LLGLSVSHEPPEFVDAAAVMKMEAPVLLAVITWLKGAAPATVVLKLSAATGVKLGVVARAAGHTTVKMRAASQSGQWRASF
jgi:hypothetical protein